MKRIATITFIIFCFLTIVKADPQLTRFTASNQITTEGKLLINSTVSTSLTFNLEFTRGLSTSGSYENVTLTFYLFLKSSTGVIEQLGSGTPGTYNLSTSDYNQSPTASKSVTVLIGAGKIGQIYVNYYYTNSSGISVGPISSATIYNTSLTGTLLTNSFNGNFVEAQGKIYWCFEGKWRHIQNWATYIGLFDNQHSNDYLLYTYPPNPAGVALGPNNGLRILPTGQIYFLEGNTVRYITSWAVFTKYHFNPDALNYTQSKVNSISQYVLGPPIY